MKTIIQVIKGGRKRTGSQENVDRYLILLDRCQFCLLRRWWSEGYHRFPVTKQSESKVFTYSEKYWGRYLFKKYIIQIYIFKFQTVTTSTLDMINNYRAWPWNWKWVRENSQAVQYLAAGSITFIHCIFINSQLLGVTGSRLYWPSE